ncbi:MAG TPA: Mrp/NBP35 family ATP-binding protein [Calditerricola sp.]
MITRESVLEALRHVRDPELNRSIVELGMVRDVVIDGDSVRLAVVLTVAGCPLKARIEEDVVNAIKQLGAKEVHVTFGAMTDEERAALAARLKGEQGKASENASGSVPPLLAPGSPTVFIAVASGKGGVGKSTVAVNLAVALARAGHRVGLIDADIYGFSVPDLLGIDQRPTVIDDVILPVTRFGVKVMSMGFFVEENTPVIWRGPMLGKMLRHFFHDVHWGELDYLILDLPPGTGDVALDVHQLLPQSKEILVTTPHPTAAFVAARAGAMALRTHHEILGVVENMSYVVCSSCGHKEHIFGQGGGEKLARELGTELLVQLPLVQPPARDIDDPDFAPGLYPADSEMGRLYDRIAARIDEKCRARA